MATSTQGLLSRSFVADALTQEVHELLSRTHVRPILEALGATADGRAARWVDIHVVGESGSPKTAFVTLNRLAKAGWVVPRGPKGSRVWTITDRGRRALEYSRQGDSIGNGGVGDR